ncbi:hypothetical protein T492DRAFT_940320 [Pavlovales sp. CCMP2436]|nr:hypothetical protein T492DRAFT_940320 [Pavlovales sp. CCMP2436]
MRALLAVALLAVAPLGHARSVARGFKDGRVGCAARMCAPLGRHSVGVIGGGVSGIWAATELVRLGYEVTLLEAEAELGGKARSFELDDGGPGSVRRSYPLGAVMTPFALRENSFAEAKPLEAPLEFAWQVLTYSRRRLQLLHANWLVVGDKTTDSFAARGPLRTVPFDLGKDSAVDRAVSSWRSAFGVSGLSERFYAHKIDFGSAEGARLAQPAAAELLKWGSQLREWPLVFTSSHGYGLLDGDATPPYYYWLRFMQKATNVARLGVWWRHGAGLPGGPTGPSLRGFDHNTHFLSVVSEAGPLLKVHMSACVTSVCRPPTGARRDPCDIKVCTTAGNFAFDSLIVAMDLKAARRFLDSEVEEAAMAAQIRHLTYYTVVSRATVPALEPGRVFYVSNSQTTAELCAPTIMLKPYADSDVLITWAYGQPPQEPDGVAVGAAEASERAAAERAALESRVMDSVGRLGGKFHGIERVERWGEYFPHVGSEDLRAGFHSRLDALQGGRGTYYVGEICNLPLVSECIDFARYLVRRCFAPQSDLLTVRQEKRRPVERAADAELAAAGRR